MDLANVVLSVCGFLGAFFLYQLSDAVKEVTKSIKDLNEKVAVVIERTETHGFEIQVLREKHDNIASDVAHIKAHLGDK